MICPKCKGIKPYIIVGPCDFCYGKKDLDWIDLIIGVDEPYDLAKYHKIMETVIKEALKKCYEDIEKTMSLSKATGVSAENIKKLFGDKINEMSKM